MDNIKIAHNKLSTSNYLKKRIIHFFFNKNMYNNIKLLKIILDYILNVQYEISPILKQIIFHGDIVFDIGANMGQYACRLNKLVGHEGKIYSFEPVSFNYDALRKMKKLLNLSNVEIYKYGVHNNEGFSEIKIPEFENGLVVGTRATINEIPNTKCKIEKIASITIDKFVKKNSISKVDFIKCDTEGNEVNVLKGGEKTIRKHLPIMLLEIDFKNPFLKILYDLGYCSFYYDFKIKRLKQIKEKQIGNLILIPRFKIKKIINILN